MKKTLLTFIEKLSPNDIWVLLIIVVILVLFVVVKKTEIKTVTKTKTKVETNMGTRTETKTVIKMEKNTEINTIFLNAKNNYKKSDNVIMLARNKGYAIVAESLNKWLGLDTDGEDKDS